MQTLQSLFFSEGGGGVNVSQNVIQTVVQQFAPLTIPKLSHHLS